MRHLFRRLTLSIVAAVAFAVGALVGPAGAQVAAFYTYPVFPSPADVGNYAAIRSVAVISAIGKDLTLSKIRFLGARTAKVDIADWRIDEFATTAVKSYLGARFTYEDVAYDRDAIAAIPNGGVAISAPQLRAVLQKLPANTADAYIVLRPNTDYEDQTTQQGLALVQPQGDGGPTVIANFEIAIIDAKSLNTVGRASSRIQLRTGGYNVPHFAHLVGRRSLQLPDTPSLSDAQRTELQSTMRGLLKYSILETLRALKPDTELPPIGARVFAPRPAEPVPYPEIHNVAVVSAIGDRFEFLNDKVSTPIAEWNIDDEVEDLVRTSLTKRITVTEAALDRSAIAQSELLDKDGNYAPRFVGLEASQTVDAYLMVLKLNRQIPALRSDLGGGVGLYDEPASLKFATPPGVYASCVVVLIDAKTLKPIRVLAGTVGPNYPRALPFLEGELGLWPKQTKAPTSAEMAAIRPLLSRLLKDTIDETLLQMDLTDQRVSDDLPRGGPLASR
jgi:hypothetical protein